MDTAWATARFTCVVLTNIRLQQAGHAALLDDRIRYRLAVLGGARCNQHLGAGIGEAPRDALADALAGAGDQCDFAFQVSDHVGLHPIWRAFARCCWTSTGGRMHIQLTANKPIASQFTCS